MSNAPRVPPPDPAGRLDLLLVRSAELLTRRFEKALGVPIWTEDLAAALQELIEDAGVPHEPIDVDHSIGNLLAAAIRQDRPSVRRRRARSSGRSHVR